MHVSWSDLLFYLLAGCHHHFFLLPSSNRALGRTCALHWTPDGLVTKSYTPTDARDCSVCVTPEPKQKIELSYQARVRLQHTFHHDRWWKFKFWSAWTAEVASESLATMMLTYTTSELLSLLASYYLDNRLLCYSVAPTRGPTSFELVAPKGLQRLPVQYNTC